MNQRSPCSWALGSAGQLLGICSTRFQRGFPGTPNSDYPGRWDLRGGGWYQSFLYTTAIIVIALQLLPADIILEPEPQHSPHRTANTTPWTVNQQTASAPILGGLQDETFRQHVLVALFSGLLASWAACLAAVAAKR